MINLYLRFTEALTRCIEERIKNNPTSLSARTVLTRGLAEDNKVGTELQVLSQNKWRLGTSMPYTRCAT